jgi:hypothetical protein
MSLVDLFNPSFLMFLGILVLVVALLVVYFESKFREQNHKIASMLSIVSSVAEELNNMRGAINLVGGSINNDNSPNIIELNSSFNSNSNINNNFEQIKRMDLIEVSDDEEDDDEEDLEEDSVEDLDEDSVEDSVEEDSVEEDSVEEDDDFVEADLEEVKDIKVLKLSVSGTNINVDINQDDINHEEIDDLHNDEEIDELHNDDIDFDDNESIVSIDATSIHDIKISNFDLKSISFDTNLEEKSQLNNSEYKKLSANKLKNIAIEKGLTNKSSKLSKQELLSLLKTQ